MPKKEVIESWTNGNFIKTQKVNGVGVASPQMEELLVLPPRDMSINQIATITPDETGGVANQPVPPQVSHLVHGLCSQPLPMNKPLLLARRIALGNSGAVAARSVAPPVIISVRWLPCAYG